jgi:hypothetical protein
MRDKEYCLTNSSMHLILCSLFIICLSPAIVFPGPRIEVDTPVYDMGVVFDSAVRSFTHKFTVKNTGDAPLVISSIRKTCGCTSVKFDSVIPPAGTGTITEIISTDDPSKGPFSMPITVISDARNSPIFKLSVKGIFKRIIDVDPTSVNITTRVGKDSIVYPLTLRTNMNGLKVSSVAFYYQEKNQAFSWKSSFPLVSSFSAIDEKKGTKKAVVKHPKEYAYAYLLKIIYPRTEQISRIGDIIITTNHPEKPEITITGNFVIQ